MIGLRGIAGGCEAEGKQWGILGLAKPVVLLSRYYPGNRQVAPHPGSLKTNPTLPNGVMDCVAPRHPCRMGVRMRMSRKQSSMMGTSSSKYHKLPSAE